MERSPEVELAEARDALARAERGSLAWHSARRRIRTLEAVIASRYMAPEQEQTS